MVELQIVDLAVVGSNPIDHPTISALVAQLDRATDFESVGRTFESCRAQGAKSGSFKSSFIITIYKSFQYSLNRVLCP